MVCSPLAHQTDLFRCCSPLLSLILSTLLPDVLMCINDKALTASVRFEAVRQWLSHLDAPEAGFVSKLDLRYLLHLVPKPLVERDPGKGSRQAQQPDTVQGGVVLHAAHDRRADAAASDCRVDENAAHRRDIGCGFPCRHARSIAGPDA